MLDGKYPDQFLISLDYDQVDAIVEKELLNAFKSLQFRAKPPMFSYDEAIDHAMILKHRDAFETVLKYYGVKVDADTGNS
jgi:hypothetical protein